MNKSFATRVAFLLLPLPGHAYAEVSDKAASIPQIWLTYIAIGLAALLLGRLKLALGLVIFPIGLLLAYVNHDTLSDPFVGRALIAEQGSPYLFATYGGAILMLAMICIGIWLGWRRELAK